MKRDRSACPRPPRRATRVGRWRERARSSRGVTLVEAAFVTPVFFVLVFGTIEIGLAMNDYLAVANAVRAGARTASATGNDPYGDYSTLKVISQEAAALNSPQISYIVIYKATDFGAKPTSTCRSGTPVSGVCNVYTPADFAKAKDDFACSDPASPSRHWCPSTRKVTLAGTGTDYVGVWMTYTHQWVTKMFGSSKVLDDSSVIRLEPRSRS